MKTSMETKQKVGSKVAFGILVGLAVVGGIYFIFSLMLTNSNTSRQGLINKNVELPKERYLVILNKDSVASIDQIEQELVNLGLDINMTIRPYVIIARQSVKSNPAWQRQIQPKVFKIAKDSLNKAELNDFFGQELDWLVEYWNNSIMGKDSVKMAIESGEEPTASESDDIPIYGLAKKPKVQPAKAGPQLPFDFDHNTTASWANAMRGKIGVQVIFVESSGHAEDWQHLKINEIISRIVFGHDFWQTRAAQNNPPVNLDFDFEFITPFNHPELVTISSEPINCNANLETGCSEDVWAGQVIDNLDSYYGRSTSGFIYERLKAHYIYLMQEKNNQGIQLDQMYTIFVVNSTNDPDELFADSGRPYTYVAGGPMVISYDQNNLDFWAGGPIWTLLASPISHELGHAFNALDEYKDGCSCNESWNGCPNENCETGVVTINQLHFATRCDGSVIFSDFQCPMSHAKLFNLCSATRCHVGWSCPQKESQEDIHDSPFTAKELTLTASRQYVSPYLCPTFGEDWYKFTVDTSKLKFSLQSPNSRVYRLALFDSQGNFLQRTDNQVESTSLNYEVNAGTYYLRVYGKFAVEPPNYDVFEDTITDWDSTHPYFLYYSLETRAACADSGCFVPTSCGP